MNFYCRFVKFYNLCIKLCFEKKTYVKKICNNFVIFDISLILGHPVSVSSKDDNSVEIVDSVRVYNYSTDSVYPQEIEEDYISNA